MDKGKKKEGKTGIFNSLKERFWLNSDNRIKTFFKSKSSESSLCNLSSGVKNCNGTPTNSDSRSSELGVNQANCEHSTREKVNNEFHKEINQIRCQSREGINQLNCEMKTEDEVNDEPHEGINQPYIELRPVEGVLEEISDEEIEMPTITITEHIGYHNDPCNHVITDEEGRIYSNALCAQAVTPPKKVKKSSNANHANEISESDCLGLYEEIGYSVKTGLTCELIKLFKYGWYWGNLSREEAEEELNGQPDGAFLLRDSSADRFILSLSFRSSGKTLHTRIEYGIGGGLYSFYQQSDQSFTSIADLVQHSMKLSKTNVYCYSRSRSSEQPSFPVRLTKPVSRFAQVRSLQYLCRFVIRESIRLDYIQTMQLPNKIKAYIVDGHF